MSPEQLAARYRQAVRSNAGQLRDSGGDPSRQMIAQLVAIAEEHARQPPDHVAPRGVPMELAEAEPEPPAAPPRRRAPARRSAK